MCVRSAAVPHRARSSDDLPAGRLIRRSVGRAARPGRLAGVVAGCPTRRAGRRSRHPDLRRRRLLAGLGARCRGWGGGSSSDRGRVAPADRASRSCPRGQLRSADDLELVARGQLERRTASSSTSRDGLRDHLTPPADRWPGEPPSHDPGVPPSAPSDARRSPASVHTALVSPQRRCRRRTLLATRASPRASVRVSHAHRDRPRERRAPRLAAPTRTPSPASYPRAPPPTSCRARPLSLDAFAAPASLAHLRPRPPASLPLRPLLLFRALPLRRHPLRPLPPPLLHPRSPLDSLPPPLLPSPTPPTPPPSPPLPSLSSYSPSLSSYSSLTLPPPLPPYLLPSPPHHILTSTLPLPKLSPPQRPPPHHTPPPRSF